MKARDWEIVNEIGRRGRIWLEQPFPAGCGGQEVEGIDLVLLDTFAAGCITSFVGNRGRIEPNQIAVLKECLHDLDSVVPLLEGEARTYFQEMRNITDQIVHSLRR